MVGDGADSHRSRVMRAGSVPALALRSHAIACMAVGSQISSVSARERRLQVSALAIAAAGVISSQLSATIAQPISLLLFLYGAVLLVSAFDGRAGKILAFGLSAVGLIVALSLLWGIVPEYRLVRVDTPLTATRATPKLRQQGAHRERPAPSPLCQSAHVDARADVNGSASSPKGPFRKPLSSTALPTPDTYAYAAIGDAATAHDYLVGGDTDVHDYRPPSDAPDERAQKTREPYLEPRVSVVTSRNQERVWRPDSLSPVTPSDWSHPTTPASHSSGYVATPTSTAAVKWDRSQAAWNSVSYTSRPPTDARRAETGKIVTAGLLGGAIGYVLGRQ
jgi:hypothetical protein